MLKKLLGLGTLFMALLLIFVLAGCPFTPTQFTLTMEDFVGNGVVDPSVGDHTYLEGETVTLSATPDGGWQFVKWQVNGNDYSTENIATLEMDADKVVKAFFEEIPPEEYTLTMLEPEGNGSIDPSVGDHYYTEGTEITLTATPDNGWEFVRWEVDGTEYSTDLATTLTMDSDKEAKAFFEKEEPPVVEHTLIMLEPEGEGTTSPTSPGSYTYDEDTVVTLVATPADGWEFVKWEVDGVVETVSSTTIVMNKNITAKAFFEEIPPEEYTLTMLEPVGEGTTSPTSPGTYTYDKGTEVTLVATPADGWEFVKWEVDGVVETVSSTTIVMNKNITAKAFFEEIPPEEYTLTMLEPVGEGTTSPTSPGTYTYDKGTEVTLVATPADGWEFVKWEVDGVVETVSSTTIVMNKNITAKAFFEKEEPPVVEYTLTMLEPDGEGTTSPTSPGTYTYDKGTEVTLVATPADGWEFVKWEVDGVVETVSSTTIVMNKDITAKAFFEKEEPTVVEYTLTMLEPDGEGTTSPTSPGTYTYEEDTVVTLVANPADGWEFVKWEADSVAYSTDKTATLTMNSDKEVQAFFTEMEPNKYTLVAIPVGDGWINIDPKKEKYDEGETVELQAIAKKGSEFKYWTGDIDPTPMPNISITMNEDKTIYAVFEAVEPTIEILSTPGTCTTNKATGVFTFSFHSANKSIDICDVNAIVNNGSVESLDYEINNDTGEGTLTWNYGEADCEIITGEIIVEDCKGNVAKEPIEIRVDTVKPVIQNFEGTDLSEESCNTDWYTTLDWNITDGSFSGIQQVCDIATITVSHGYLTDYFVTSTSQSTVTDLVEPIDKVYDTFYWVLEVPGTGFPGEGDRLDCVDVTATLTARDICCDCTNTYNESATSVTYRVDNLSPRIETWDTGDLEAYWWYFVQSNPYVLDEVEHEICNTSTQTTINWDVVDNCLDDVFIYTHAILISDNATLLEENPSFLNLKSPDLNIPQNNRKSEFDKMDEISTQQYYYKPYLADPSGQATLIYENIDCEIIYLDIYSADNCSNYSEQLSDILIDNVPPSINVFETDLPEECSNATYTELSWGISDGSYEDDPQTCKVATITVSDGYLTNELDKTTSDLTLVTDMATDSIYWVFGNLDCVDVSATITAQDQCCGKQFNECKECRNISQATLTHIIDNVKPVINEFAMNNIFESEDCNTATYTEVDWDITDGSFDTDPQACNVATITVDEGYLTSSLDVVTTETSTTTDYASSTSKTLYWVFEDLDGEEITATLTAWDACCCGGSRNAAEPETRNFYVDNVSPTIEDFSRMSKFEIEISEGLESDATAELHISVLASDFDRVEIETTEGTTFEIPALEEQDFDWSVDLPLIEDTVLLATATAFDDCGNATSSVISVNVYTFTIEATPSGGGSTDPATGAYNYPWPLLNPGVSLHAYPSIGYEFVEWTGDYSSPSNPYSINLPGYDSSIIANFRLVDYALSVVASPTEGGIVTGSGTYNFVDIVDITAEASPGYQFVQWTDTAGSSFDDNDSSATETTYTMPAEDATVTGIFELIDYELTVVASPTEGGTVTGSGTYNYGDTVNITAEASPEYEFDNWTDTAGSSFYNSSATETTYTMPAEDATVTGNFPGI